MPLYMDIHTVPGVKSRDVAEAHRQDLIHQHEYGCNCMTYWIDEDRETIFCLIEAPNKDAVKKMHKKAHGLVPNRIIEVSSSVVQSFLGRIYDPEDAVTDGAGIKVFSDPSFRLLMVTQLKDHVLLAHQLGQKKADHMITGFNELARNHFSEYGGSEVEHPGEGFIVSFDSATNAVSAALAINKSMPLKDAAALECRLAINGGEPIEKSKELFGDTINLATYLCQVTGKSQVAISSRVKELISKELFQSQKKKFFTLAQPDEADLHQLFSTLEKNFHDPTFDIPEYAQALAMSQTQLYRKTTSLTGLSCNALVKDFRLHKAKELMKKRMHSVSQITFETGFSSPSYFTKCFKAKYGLLPNEYISFIK